MSGLGTPLFIFYCASFIAFQFKGIPPWGQVIKFKWNYAVKKICFCNQLQSNKNKMTQIFTCFFLMVAGKPLLIEDHIINEVNMKIHFRILSLFPPFLSWFCSRVRLCNLYSNPIPKLTKSIIVILCKFVSIIGCNSTQWCQDSSLTDQFVTVS